MSNVSQFLPVLSFEPITELINDCRTNERMRLDAHCEPGSGPTRLPRGRHHHRKLPIAIHLLHN